MTANVYGETVDIEVHAVHEDCEGPLPAAINIEIKLTIVVEVVGSRKEVIVRTWQIAGEMLPLVPRAQSTLTLSLPAGAFMVAVSRNPCL